MATERNVNGIKGPEAAKKDKCYLDRNMVLSMAIGNSIACYTSRVVFAPVIVVAQVNFQHASKLVGLLSD